jgi:hypothetical protein
MPRTSVHTHNLETVKCDHSSRSINRITQYIHQGDAAPTAEELITLLAENTDGNRAFGDLLLAIRRKLLLKGRIMGLALVGFGDADWRLE